MPAILLIIYLLLETFLSFHVIAFLGVFGFVVEVIVSGVLGLFLVASHWGYLGNALERLRMREIDVAAFVSGNAFRIFGAFLLILPGIFTDIFGILMQFSAVMLILMRPFATQPKEPSSPHGEIIDVEVIEKEPK